MRVHDCRMALCAALALIPFVCMASVAPKRLTYNIGTGFFVSRDGYLVTNYHVVSGCKQVVVQGAVAESPASLVAVHEAWDLALLRSAVVPMGYAKLHDGAYSIPSRERVVVVGYPGQSWRVQSPVLQEAQVEAVSGFAAENTWLAVSDRIALGNSGGPLLNNSGHVVGVVAAKATRYKDAAHTIKDTSVDLAVRLSLLRQFLDASGVRYVLADSGIYHGRGKLMDMARMFVVNVRCRYMN